MSENYGISSKENYSSLLTRNYGWRKQTENYTSTDAIIDFGLQLQQCGLQMPIVPAHLRQRVLANTKWFGISTEHCANPMDTYLMPGRSWVPQIAELTPYDFMVFAHAGHGLNSYAMGLVARIGCFTIFQQSNWGGVYQNPELQRERLAAQIEVWNEMSEFLANIKTASEYEYLISFSPFRGVANISRRRWQSPWTLETSDESTLEKNRDWEIDIDLTRDSVDAQRCLDWLAGKPDHKYTRDMFIQEIGREYLYRLTVANAKVLALVQDRAQKSRSS
ncbi:MAG: hypothetical protein EBS36_03735 [Actinobacteria bacterium]|nr:hypothetical protein [Actinomycetota bacterium]NBY15666.1 hypothetical protein [Actinomycetota bacterium]